jgi:membrane protease YdiL (CAAX protease family)
LLAVLLAAFAVFLFDLGYAGLVTRITGKPLPDQAILAWLSLGAQGLSWLAVVGIVLAGPIAEEIVFRGLLFGALEKRLPAGWTISITATCFALAHLQPIYFVPIFAVGLMLGWVRHKSGGIALPLVIHCLNNAVGLLIALYRLAI